MRIGISAPYDRSEATIAAIRLADLAMELSLSANIISNRPVEQGVHPFWDRYVRGHKGDNIYRWASKCDHFVWFSVNNRYVKMAKLVSPRASHVMVPLWHHARREDFDDLEQFDLVVCPSVQLRDFLVEHLMEKGVSEDDARRRIAFCKWESGLTPVRQSRMGEQPEAGLYIHLDSFAVDECGIITLRLVDDLLEMIPDISVTMSCAKSWSRRSRAVIKKMLKRWGTRFLIKYRTSLPEQLTDMHANDWSLIPSPRVDIGVMAMRSLSCGVPVITFDVPPLGELLSPSVNASLIPCELSFNWMGAPIACPRTPQMMTACIQAISSPTEDQVSADSSGPATMVKGSNPLLTDGWQLSKRQRAFSSFWAQLWGVESL